MNERKTKKIYKLLIIKYINLSSKINKIKKTESEYIELKKEIKYISDKIINIENQELSIF